ncbi:MAG: hypothetical protein FWG73_06520 [Planctomycetaceae bacterium]|nr:hypothetical protein [Planctomycetaceae bacterium]
MSTRAEAIAKNTAAKAPKTIGQKLDRTLRVANVAGKKTMRFAKKNKVALIASGAGAAAIAGGGYLAGRASGKRKAQNEQ